MNAFAFKIAALVLSVGGILVLTQCGRLAEDGIDEPPAQCPSSAGTTSCNLPNETPCDFASPGDCRGLTRWICEDGQWHDYALRVGSPGGVLPCSPDAGADDDVGDGWN
jgi:hypothetical protein